MSLTSLTNIRERIFTIKDESTFNEVALAIFLYQAENLAIYKRYLHLLKIDISKINHYTEIPFLPIEFFKSHKILADENLHKPISLLFKSSGTTGENTSSHFIIDEKIYHESFTKGFQHFYGAISDWNFLALLPSYLERENSSLVYMVKELMKISNKEANQFYIHDHDVLFNQLKNLEAKKEKSILIGVSYALLDFIEKYPIALKHTTIMETGGMKGQRKEITKAALHQTLQAGFQVSKIHSEYGMTELLSQAYSTGDGIYSCPPWMKIICKELNDPFQNSLKNQTGRINVIDLANLNSVSFIETADMGKVYENGTFEILGRIENSIMRGCNLLVS